MGVSRSEGRSGSRVAPAWHTVTVLLALVSVSLAGAASSPMSKWPETLSQPGARVLLYAKIVALQWAWVAYVWFGLRRARYPFRMLIQTPGMGRRWLGFIAVGLGGFLCWLIVSAGLGAILRPSAVQLAGLAAMLPHTTGERALWIVFAMSAAVCEEIVYRGYLLRQFTAFTGSRLAGVILQALIYGTAHLVLPAEMIASVVLLGLLLGAVAVWRKSLVPAMILHVGTGLMALLSASR